MMASKDGHPRKDGHLPRPLPMIDIFVPPLTAEEIEHYRWLITGLMEGSTRLAALGGHERSAALAMNVARSLFDEMIARIPAMHETRLKDVLDVFGDELDRDGVG